MSVQNIRSKIAIVGAGNVGSTFAFALMISGLPREIVIIDMDEKRAEGECMDLSHGASFVSPVSALIDDYYGIDEVCLSIPSVVNRNGVEKILRLKLSKSEEEKLRHSAATLKNIIKNLKW